MYVCSELRKNFFNFDHKELKNFLDFWLIYGFKSLKEIINFVKKKEEFGRISYSSIKINVILFNDKNFNNKYT